jgi:hypothetical protein
MALRAIAPLLLAAGRLLLGCWAPAGRRRPCTWRGRTRRGTREVKVDSIRAVAYVRMAGRAFALESSGPWPYANPGSFDLLQPPTHS